MKQENRAMISVTKKTPYKASDIVHVVRVSGENLPVQPVMWFCKCGSTKKSPWCDGSHLQASFKTEKEPNRRIDAYRPYKGDNITILYNTGICCHDGSCTRLLPNVFNPDRKPWILPNEASVEEIIHAIKTCPSGALRYCISSGDCETISCEPTVRVHQNGPLECIGEIDLQDEQGSCPRCENHYTLCRCGKSKNVPFCDGEHYNHPFE